MKFIITESQFKTIIESEVPLQVRRRTFWFEDYLEYTLNYMDNVYRHYFMFFDDYLDKVIQETVDRLYWGWFSEMDETSDEWKQSAEYISDYIRNNFYDKIKTRFISGKEKKSPKND